MKKKEFDFFPLIIAFFAVLSYSRLLFFRDVFWDDNCWLMAAYSSSNLDQFLDKGFYEIRRVLLGVFLYFFFSLSKSTGHAYLIWHSVNLSIQILAPVFLYLFLNNLLKDKKSLSFFAALIFAIFPLDTTLPYLSAINYRIATMLAIISLCLTQRAFEKEDARWALLVTALAISAISYYVFLEMTIVFEGARLFVIGYIFYKRGSKGKSLIRDTIGYWLPFFLICIPLVLYKLIYKPYGIYSGMYKTDFLFFMNWKSHADVLRVFLFDQWKISLPYIRNLNLWSIILGILAAGSSFFLLEKMTNIPEAGLIYNGGFKNRWNYVSAILLFGLIFLIPPMLFLEFAGLEISSGLYSSHLNQLQIGYSMILGAILYSLFTISSFSLSRTNLINLFIGILVGFGVLFNNLNLDTYFKSWERQEIFWKAFTGRFPSLPENAVFMMDVRDFYFYDATDLDNAYDLEFILNLLYANSKRPEDFRKYKVFPLEEFRPEMADRFRCDQANEDRLERVTHFGKDALNPCEFIIVYYRDGKLLVNREIKEMLPDISYREWLKNDFPVLPDKPAAYPLRYKLNGFSDGNAL
jgi:hypothetical protein